MPKSSTGESINLRSNLEKIWLSAPHMSGKEQKYIDDAFARGHIFPMGPNVAGLESDICVFTSSKACACVSSGTAAIHLALIMLGVRQGDEVICSSFTFSASVNPIRYQGAIPVFVDSESLTWNMDPEILRYAIQARIATTGQKPKAIILVHLYGMPARLDEIVQIANEFDIPIIEDAAEALGSTFKDLHCGTFGEIGVYSFNGNKIITTSGGGALISDNSEYCQKAIFLATQARDPAPHYQHSEIGYNYRMSNISAGIGRGQMEVLSDHIEKRRANFFFYKNALAELDDIQFQTEPSSEYFSNHWLSTFVIDRDSSVDREDLRLHLEALNIETRPLWNPMHLQPVFRDCPKHINGVSEDLFIRGLCLPSSSNLSNDDRDFVVDSIKDYFGKG
ncbi:MAG: aminotransferase class I/II-fold pyridoxal phosphate-dependent enzyme [Saprospiraceae bacterium]|nr:aminotransferase class I/II-fold pyridoxal phosphate-dependent enzyme [Saprospiraceae bacterium]